MIGRIVRLLPEACGQRLKPRKCSDAI
jgi:hypothetical protein